MNIRISRDTLEQARAFLEAAGSIGHEGTGMLAGSIDAASRSINRFFAPDQRAGDYPKCWVEVTHQGKHDLALALGAGERWLARIHSHPGEGFHSTTDDRNPGLTAEGTLSIVVPYFGLALRRGLDACAVYEYREGAWRLGTPASLGIEVR